MSYKHYPTAKFIKEASAIKKVYPSFGGDLKQMRRDIDNLFTFKNQSHIDDLGGGLFKYRLKIADKPANKSYGARIIFFYLSNENELWYLTCYDKSDADNVTHADQKNFKKIITEIKVTSPKENRLKLFGVKSLARRVSSGDSKRKKN